MRYSKRLGHAGVGKLGAVDIAALLATVALVVSGCALLHMLAG